jgi:predicted nucleic acid-binding protein
MIVLDTNVLSALMPPQPTTGVLAWLDRQPPDSIWITSVTYFEVLFGVALLPAGKRRNDLQSALERLTSQLLEDRVLDFDRQAASAAARLAATQRSAGQHIDFRDMQIAGIALSRRAALATRNVRHFEGAGLKLVNPWE